MAVPERWPHGPPADGVGRRASERAGRKSWRPDARPRRVRKVTRWPMANVVTAHIATASKGDPMADGQCSYGPYSYGFER